MTNGDKITLTKNNLHRVARWCHGIVGKYYNHTAVFFNSGFEDEMAFPGDTIEFKNGIFRKL